MATNIKVCTLFLLLSIIGANAQNPSADNHYSQQNYQDAYPLYLSSAEAGDIDSAYRVGYMNHRAQGIAINYLTARIWYTKAANGEHRDAMKGLGDLYFNGLGTQKNIQRGLEWYTKAAEAGHADAAYQTADIYMSGKEVITNYHEAARLYELALSGGINKAGLALGKIYSTNVLGNHDIPRTIRKLEFAALDPEPGEHRGEAAHFLSQIYIGGANVPEDKQTSIKWLEIAADNGIAAAAADVGLRYYQGNGVAADPAKAYKYIRAAAVRNNANAQFNLGLFYYQGTGTEKDNVKALTWFKIAALTDPAMDNGTIAQFTALMDKKRRARVEAEVQKWINGRQ